MCLTCLPCLGASAWASYKVGQQCSGGLWDSQGSSPAATRWPPAAAAAAIDCRCSLLPFLLPPPQVNKSLDKTFSSKQPADPVEPSFVTEAKLRWNVRASPGGSALQRAGGLASQSSHLQPTIPAPVPPAPVPAAACQVDSWKQLSGVAASGSRRRGADQRGGGTHQARRQVEPGAKGEQAAPGRAG